MAPPLHQFQPPASETARYLLLGETERAGLPIAAPNSGPTHGIRWEKRSGCFVLQAMDWATRTWHDVPIVQCTGGEQPAQNPGNSYAREVNSGMDECLKAPSSDQLQNRTQNTDLLDKLRREFEHFINCRSLENQSDTPDFILAQYLLTCLQAWNMATTRRDEWYKHDTLSHKRSTPPPNPADVPCGTTGPGK